MLREPSKNTARKSIVVEVLIQNTWTSIALNNLGLAFDDHFDKLEYLHGRTYVD